MEQALQKAWKKQQQAFQQTLAQQIQHALHLSAPSVLASAQPAAGAGPDGGDADGAGAGAAHSLTEITQPTQQEQADCRW